MSETPAIEFTGVSRWYGDTVAVADVTFAVGPGVTGLLGHNGAGKSTLMKMLAGAYPIDSGEVRVAGRPASIVSRSGRWPAAWTASRTRRGSRSWTRPRRTWIWAAA